MAWAMKKDVGFYKIRGSVFVKNLVQLKHQKKKGPNNMGINCTMTSGQEASA